MKVRSRSTISCPQVMLFLFIIGVTASSCLYDANSGVTAAQEGQDWLEKSPRVMNLPQVVSFVHSLAKPVTYEDPAWPEKHSTGVGKSSAGMRAVAKIHRALSLNQNAQRELLRHAPME